MSALGRRLRDVSLQGDGQSPFRPPGFQGRRLFGKEQETIQSLLSKIETACVGGTEQVSRGRREENNFFLEAGTDSWGDQEGNKKLNIIEYQIFGRQGCVQRQQHVKTDVAVLHITRD